VQGCPLAHPVHHWKKELSSGYQLDYHLAFTKNAQEPTLAANKLRFIANSLQTRR
jgi:hypothetical protein